MKKKIIQNYNIIGLGGVGSHIAIQLSEYAMYIKKYIDNHYSLSILMIDGDVVDNKFLNRVSELKLLYPYSIGMKKVEVLHDYLMNLYPFEYHYYDYYLTSNTKDTITLLNDSLTFICVDNETDRKFIEDYINYYGSKYDIYVHVGFDHHRLTVYKSVFNSLSTELDVDNPNRTSSYDVPPTSVELRNSAIELIEYYLNREYNIHIKQSYFNW